MEAGSDAESQFMRTVSAEVATALAISRDHIEVTQLAGSDDTSGAASTECELTLSTPFSSLPSLRWRGNHPSITGTSARAARERGTATGFFVAAMGRGEGRPQPPSARLSARLGASQSAASARRHSGFANKITALYVDRLAAFFRPAVLCRVGYVVSLRRRPVYI